MQVFARDGEYWKLCEQATADKRKFISGLCADVEGFRVRIRRKRVETGCKDHDLSGASRCLEKATGIGIESRWRGGSHVPPVLEIVRVVAATRALLPIALGDRSAVKAVENFLRAGPGHAHS